MNGAKWVVSGVALTALVWMADMASGTVLADETWWLHISGRFNSGEMPYADFNLGVLPLPLYLTSAATSVLGLELWVTKLLIDACVAVTALLAAWTARYLGVPRVGAALVALASVSFVLLPTVTLYSPLSYLLLLATLALTLAWHRSGKGRGRVRRTDLLLFAAGATAGASVAGKQTVGFAAFGALLVCVFVYSPYAPGFRQRARDAALVAPAAVFVIAVVMAPVALGGGLGAFYEQALDKGEYVDSGTISFPEGVGDLLDVSSVGEDPWLLRFLGVYALPVLALLTLVAASLRRQATELIPVGLFTAAAVAASLPRADFFHMSDVAPMCALAIAVSVNAMMRSEAPERRAWAMPAAFCCVAVLSAAAAVGLLREPIRQLSDGASPSGLPHLAGVLLVDQRVEDAHEQAAALRLADQSENSTFLLVPSASFLYLISGLSNPTRFDYPLLTVLRDTGQREVIEDIRSGHLRRVCLGSFDGDPSAQPSELVDSVRDELKPLQAAGPPLLPGYESCELFSP